MLMLLEVPPPPPPLMPLLEVPSLPPPLPQHFLPKAHSESKSQRETQLIISDVRDERKLKDGREEEEEEKEEEE